MKEHASCAAVRPQALRTQKGTSRVSKLHHPRMMERMRNDTIAVSCHGCKSPMQVSKLRASASQGVIFCPKCLDVCEACGENDEDKLKQDPDSNQKLCQSCLKVIGEPIRLIVEAAHAAL